jgi:CubicO group peptidase (beta-lactamase class C family)
MAGDEEAAAVLIAAGADADVPWPAPEEVLDARLQEATQGGRSGVSVLVARDGQILLEQGWGYASVEHEVPFTPATKSRIGSVTKQFTAAAILRLAEQGKLGLQDPLDKYFPEFPRGSEVTLRHLLTHTSGMHNYTAKPEFMSTVTVPAQSDDLIRSFQKDPFDFAPGERWAYCNSGYFLLGAIVAKVSGCSYGDFLQREFFAPLGMTNSGVHSATAILMHEASGYSYAGGKFSKAINWDMSRAGGAGALYSTVGDLFRWNEAVFGGQVLKDDTLREAFTPVMTRQDTEPAGKKDTGYGCGWSLGKTRGLRVIEHGGGLHGFLSYLLRYPEQKLTVAVLANASDPPPVLTPDVIAAQAAELYLWREMKPRERPETLSLDVAALEAFVGRYDYGGPILTVTREGKQLHAQLTGQPRFEIFAKSADTLFWKVVEAEVQFVKNDAGEVVKAIHKQNGAVIQAPRVAEETAVQLDPGVLEACVGKYDFGDGTLILTVTREGGRLFAQMKGQPRHEIFARSETEFFWKVVAARITFVKDPEGRVIKAVSEQGGQRLEARRVE